MMNIPAALSKKLRRLVPRSLRRQSIFSVAGLALLILAGGVMAVYALRVATGTTRILVEQRLVRMQQAQDLVQRTLLIERESYQLADAESVNVMRGSYAEIVHQLEEFDRLVDSLAVGGDIAVLDLHQSSQMFRNTANIVAQLRESELHAAGKRVSSRVQSGVGGKSARQFLNELRHQASAMVSSAQAQSDYFTQNFRVELQTLAETSTRNQRWVTALLAGSLLLAWLVAYLFLGKHVLGRLQLISGSLRQSDIGDGQPKVLVQGDDEIGEMARALEQFQLDRKQLAQRSVQLEAANKELEAFSYSVSHDLRTPLRAIDGFSHILLDDYADQLDEEGKRMVGVVRKNTQRMSQLIDDILKFSRTGRLEMTFSNIDMGKMARDVFEELLPAAESIPQIEIEHLPPANGDSAMLRQVFINLLSNAIKFSRNVPVPKISVGSFVEGIETVYYVKDNGVGFDMQYVNKLFGVFQRLHAVNEFEGTGIGLAIVKRIITRHGGRVWAQGVINAGAAIYFSLPGAHPEMGGGDSHGI